MLCLTRKDGQRVQVGDIVVQVLRSRRGAVRLGIIAPPSVPILRDDAKKCGEKERKAA